MKGVYVQRLKIGLLALLVSIFSACKMDGLSSLKVAPQKTTAVSSKTNPVGPVSSVPVNVNMSEALTLSKDLNNSISSEVSLSTKSINASAANKQDYNQELALNQEVTAAESSLSLEEAKSILDCAEKYTVDECKDQAVKQL